jgi:hypothetical protein
MLRRTFHSIRTLLATGGSFLCMRGCDLERLALAHLWLPGTTLTPTATNADEIKNSSLDRVLCQRTPSPRTFLGHFKTK